MPYPLDDEDLALDLYLPERVGVKIVEVHLTRCQRAGKGAEQSPAGSGDHVVQGGGVGLFGIRGNAVVFRNLRVDAKEDRLLLRG